MKIGFWNFLFIFLFLAHVPIVKSNKKMFGAGESPPPPRRRLCTKHWQGGHNKVSVSTMYVHTTYKPKWNLGGGEGGYIVG